MGIQTWNMKPYSNNNHRAYSIRYQAIETGLYGFKINLVDIANSNRNLLNNISNNTGSVQLLI